MCAPRDAFIIPCRDAFIIPYRDAFIILAGMLGAGAVGPGGCGCGSFPYTATITAIPGPTGQAVPSKGSDRDGKASREGQQKD